MRQAVPWSRSTAWARRRSNELMQALTGATSTVCHAGSCHFFETNPTTLQDGTTRLTVQHCQSKIATPMYRDRTLAKLCGEKGNSALWDALWLALLLFTVS